MIGAADHRQALEAQLAARGRIASTTMPDVLAGGSELRHSTTAATCRRAAIASIASRMASQDAVAAGEVDVADVDLEGHPVGDAVDRPGVDAADARGRDGVGAAARDARSPRRPARLPRRRTGHRAGRASGPRRRVRPRPSR